MDWFPIFDAYLNSVKAERESEQRGKTPKN